MSILICGDTVPTNNNIELFSTGNVQALLGMELLNVFEKASYRIINLECPITDHIKCIKKCGPNLYANSDSITAIKTMRIDVAGLANNHILDQGSEGLSETIRVLNNAGIAYVGAGENLHLAKRPHFFSYEGKTVGLIACAEHEFSIRNEEDYGANPIDLLETPDDVFLAKEMCDYLIVLLHAGKEYYPYPTPNQQKLCHKLADKGADLIICQHSHCVGCREDYKHATIIYGQGNFIFGEGKRKEWETGIIIELDSMFNIKEIPITHYYGNVQLANGCSEGESILREYYDRSNKIKQEGFVLQTFQEYAAGSLNSYLTRICEKESTVFKGANYICHNKLRVAKFRRKYDEKKQLVILNALKCESHRETFIEGLQYKLNLFNE